METNSQWVGEVRSSDNVLVCASALEGCSAMDSFQAEIASSYSS